VALLQIRAGRLLAVRHYDLQNADASLPDAELLAEFLAQHHLGQAAQAEAPVADAAEGVDVDPTRVGAPPPREILVPSPVEEPDQLERALGAQVRVPEGEEETHLSAVARSHAQVALESSRSREGGHGIEALEQVQEKLHLQRLPQRIECYDISNIHGEDSVASRVVFIDGAPDKNLYRRYKIRTVEGPNDFAMMKEVLSRRFSRTEEDLPDLVVVDGGKGQLAQAVAILEELEVQGVAAVGLAKARTESDFTSSEVNSSQERIFIPGRKNPVGLHPHQAAYKLLTHVRDEAHRFALAYHRLLRGKRRAGGQD
jgi:excinuclease ABC subunit C